MTSASGTPWFVWNGVCIDCAPNEFEDVVRFYTELFGIAVLDKEERWAMVGDTSAGMVINIQAEDWYVPPTWPERADAQSKMMHFEVLVADIDQAVSRVVSLGGRQAVDQPAGRDLSHLRVMLDPAGHPFCLWSRQTPKQEDGAYWHDR